DVVVGECVCVGGGGERVVWGVGFRGIAIVTGPGPRHSANLQNLTTTIKVLAILAMSTALLVFGKNTVSLTGASSPPSGGGSLVAGFALAMISVLWAYDSWQYATFTAGETINAQRNYPRASLARTRLVP